ncbi:MAG: hypothetical protein U1F43_00990 [Myxococcota bacterium]
MTNVLRFAPALAILSLSAAALAVGCGDDGGSTTPACDASLRPVIFAHGFLAASDTWSSQVARFEQNGMCADHLAVFDWNTLAPDGAEAQLDAAIDRLLAATGASQVDLVGHSAGGGLGYRYLADPVHAAKVAHYAHLASSAETAPAGPDGDAAHAVPTLAVRSTGDTIAESAEVPGAENVVLTGADHYEVATSPETFTALWKAFEGADPTTTTVSIDRHPTLAGKALTLGENAPVPGWTVEVWRLESAGGKRLGAAPEASFTVAADGAWGPFAAASGARYELFLHAPAGTAPDEARPVHYYIEPVTHSDALLYLRALPGPGSIVGALLGQIPFDDRHVVLIAFSASKAVVAGRDTLTVGGRALATEELASAARTAIAFFLFDENSDQTSGGEASTFSALLTVFLTAVDEYLAADDPAPIALSLDERQLAIPRWPSATDGATVVIFR